MKIFLSVLETFGDVCLVSTLCRNLKLKYGDDSGVEITVVTDERYIDILKDNPDIARLWPGQAKNLFDVYIKSCYDRFDRIYLPLMTNHDDTIWHHQPEMAYYHLVDFYASRCENLELKDRRTFVYPSEQDKQVVAEALKPYMHLLTERIPVVMHTQSPVASKSWGIKNFSYLAKKLENAKCVVIQVGGAGDEKIQSPFVVDLRGKLSPRQTAWAIRHGLLYVGIDSGPAYLADAMGVPSVILYGATTHFQAGPLSRLSIPIEPKRKQEYPCGPGPITCSTHCMIGAPCILNLEREEIVEKVIGVLYNIVERIKTQQKEAVPA